MRALLCEGRIEQGGAAVVPLEPSEQADSSGSRRADQEHAVAGRGHNHHSVTPNKWTVYDTGSNYTISCRPTLPRSTNLS